MIKLASDAARWAIGSPLIQRQAIKVGDKTFFAYQGDQFDPMVGSYDHSTQAVDGPYKAGTNPLVDDAHGTPSIAVASGEKIHCAFGCHVSPLYYVRSTNNEDPSSWGTAVELASSATYPTIIRYSADDLSIFYRAGGHTADWVEITTSDGGDTWSSPTQILLGEATRFAWYASWHLDDSGVLHAGWIWQDDTNAYESPLPSHYRYSMYYAYRDTGGTWRNASGTSLPMPLDKQEIPAYCKVFGAKAGSNGHTNVPSLAVDGDDKPHLLYVRGVDISDPDVLTDWKFQHAYWTGTQWNFNDVDDCDSMFDGCALRWNGSNIEAVLCKGGTSGTPASHAEGMMDLRGGHLYEATYSGTWSVSLLNDERVFDFPAFNDDGDVLVAEMNQSFHRFDDGVFFLLR